MNQTRLEKRWAGAARVRTLLREANRDSDQVSISSFGESPGKIDGAVVVLKGDAVVRCFREWAVRNRLLTPGKPVKDPQ